MLITVEKMLPRADRVRQSRPDLFGNDPQSFRSDFTERQPGVPQLLLVEQPVPGSTILTHYHSQDQFQIFIDGNGKLGRHDVSPITLHYTNRYTGYGPIIAGDQGLSYYVVRPSFDTLVTGQYVLQADKRETLKNHPGPKLSIVGQPIVALDARALATLPSIKFEALIDAPDRDAERGLGADLVSLGPNMTYTGLDPATGSGQMVLVIGGAIEHGGTKLGARSGIALTPDEPALRIQASDEGAQVLMLQYPKRTPEGLQK